jgi:hypothetical protein
MLRNYIHQRQKMLKESNNFYTSSGIQIFTKDEIINDDINIDSVVAKFESHLPEHARDEIEMIIIGHFKEFEERGINAFYKNGAIHVSNVQDDAADLIDDLIHETAHSLEDAHGYFIYADQKLEKEFLRKRENLYNILWKTNYKAPFDMFMDSEYDQEFDEFLYQDIGYNKLSELLRGVFITPYAATSLREYFATGFTEFYLYPDNHNYLKKISPELYKKILQLHHQNFT